MIEIIDRFSVTISLINESTHQSLYETMSVHSLTVSADGMLSIQGDSHTRLFPAGLWDGFEVKVLKGGAPPRGDNA
jgi:hypothetical protein